MSKKPLFKRFVICNLLIIKCNFSGDGGKMTFLDTSPGERCEGPGERWKR
jgi:hypothetical protein